MADENPNKTSELSHDQGKTLLALARKQIADKVGASFHQMNEIELQKSLDSNAFSEKRGTFVTLTKRGQLRGCIGTIAPVDSIKSGIQSNAINAAFNDHRFPQLKPEEYGELEIEVSILSDPEILAYTNGDDLLQKLRPGIDGVILRSGGASATFLPQVWDQLPRTEDFLGRLCLKAGLPADSWQRQKMEVLTYQVQHFSE